jgi:hypothetical protein
MCALPFSHRAGRRPPATFATPLPLGDQTRWVPCCDACLEALVQDAAKDGMAVQRVPIVTEQTIHLEQAEVAP